MGAVELRSLEDGARLMSAVVGFMATQIQMSLLTVGSQGPPPSGGKMLVLRSVCVEAETISRYLLTASVTGCVIGHWPDRPLKGGWEDSWWVRHSLCKLKGKTPYTQNPSKKLGRVW